MRVLRRLLILAATAVTAFVLVLDALAVVGWPSSGPLALAQVFAGHLTILALVVVPIAFLHEARLLRVLLVVLAVVSLVRFGGEWWSLPSGVPEDVATLDLVTWNLQFDGRTPESAVAFLRKAPADVIALQELTPAVSAAIAADAALAGRYPHQALYPETGSGGMGLLSTAPLSGIKVVTEPATLMATVDGPLGPVRVVNVHPVRADVERGPYGLPTRFEPADRDAALARIRDEIAATDEGTPTVVLGDINTTPTESAFGTLAQGFRDAHAEVGLGPGWTFRPKTFEPLGIGLIRIDVVLTGPGLRTVAETTRCPPHGDHCAVLVTVVADQTTEGM